MKSSQIKRFNLPENVADGISIFHHKSASFAISRNTNIDCILIGLTYFQSLKIVSINMVTILMMSAKMGTLGILKIKVF